jgi:hypothetical protein
MFKKIIVTLSFVLLISCNSKNSNKKNEVELKYESLITNCFDSISTCVSEDKKVKVEVASLNNGNSQITFNYNGLNYTDTVKSPFSLGFNTFMYKKKDSILLIINEYFEYGNSLRVYKLYERKALFIDEILLNDESNILFISVLEKSKGFSFLIKEKLTNNNIKVSEINLANTNKREIAVLQNNLEKKPSISNSDTLSLEKGDSSNSKSNTNLLGYWKAGGCDDLVGILINEDDSMVMCVYPNQLYIHFTKIDNKGLRYKLNEMEGLGAQDYFSKSYLNDEATIEIKILDSNKIEFNWLGFYNKDNRQREHMRQLIADNNPVILHKCD